MLPFGGGGSGTQNGGNATINIAGGSIIAKSVGGTVNYHKNNNKNHTESIDAGVSIGGGTGKTSGGSVTLNISGDNTILRTGSIGGGLATEEGKKVGYAKVNITGGDIVGQVIMAGGASEGCNFKMSGGKIHDTDVTSRYEINDENITDPRKDIPIKYVRDNGGAVFINDEKGIATITGGTIENCKAKNGGAIYMNGGTANIEGGQISNNTAIENGGGVYLPGGDFTMNNGSIEGNKAKNGGGIFLSKPPTLNGGSINSNKADENGGGIYISDCVVTLQPKEAMYITKNTAKNGAGIYIHDSKSSNIADSADGSIDIVSSETIKTDAVGLLVEDGYNGHLYFTENTATNSGGAVCVDKGSFYLYSDKITVTNNKATENGGGVAVLEGNFTMTKGSIGAEGKANTAKNGGGAYVSNGEIWLKGGNINYNEATNGGGAYVIGNYNMINGDVSLNTANQSGGGIYVDNGTVTMYGGNVDKNSAENDGGGIHVSATKQDALVDILSGSISSNKAKSGGGISVVGEKGQTIEVTVGVNCEHKDRNTDNGEFTVFEYPANVIDCGKAHGSHENHIDNNLEHSSCPQVKENVASDEGGGFFLDSSHSKITIYCMWAEGNIAANDEDSKCMKVNGGELTIGDEDFDTHKNPDKGNPVKGNTTIHGSIMVEGGKVNIYGEMEGPKFHNDVKVDVKEEGDYYIDHRITESEHNDYKVHYYENFKGDGDIATGLYIARQYPDDDHVDLQDASRYDFTVIASMFTHPGYRIVGWNSQPNDDGDKYEVNETYNLEELEKKGALGKAEIDIPGQDTEHDGKLLVLYAIWEREEYILKFDPNVEPGESYSGTMDNQIVPMLDGKQTIRKNEFKRKGYEFIGWTLNPTPSDDDKVYPDEYKIEKDFTDKDGATVTLYAKWEECTHIDHLVYKADKNIMTESCDLCGGHTATATISAVDADYDEKYHLASLEYSDNWLGEGNYRPDITYEMADSSEWDDKDGVREEWNNDPQPKHAGSYTAKITVENATAMAKYEIRRIKWETPEVPEMNFKVVNNKNIIEITNPRGNSIRYKITCFDTTNEQETPVTGYLDWRKENEFSNIELGHYYYFYAKKIEDRDHFDSDPSKSESYLADGNNIIYIKSETGIKVVPDIGDGAFKYTVSAAAGYHLRNYTDNLETAVEDAKPIPGAPAEAHLEPGGIILNSDMSTKDIYTYTVKFEKDKVAYYQLTLEFSGAAKDASVSSKVIDGQIFKDFNNKKETSISNDSAFTAQFTVNDYIPDEYKEQLLKFSSNLPKDTTIIMKEEGRYWYTKLTEEKQNINLNEFIAMGESNKFKVEKMGETPKKFTYQFIVDFSQAEKNMDTVDLKVNLNLIANNTTYSAPTIPAEGEEAHISLNIKEKAKFTLGQYNLVNKSLTLKCNYVPSEGAASIWDGRDTALVLTINKGTPPADLTLTAEVDGNTTNYTMNKDKQFIIPLGEIGNKNVKITLNSNLFDSSGMTLNCSAKWYVSKSRADNSPLNGDVVKKIDSIDFACKKDDLPSLRIDGNTRLCEVGGKLTIQVNYRNILGIDKITAYLQKKDGNEYIYTGSNKEVPTNGSVEFSMGNMSKGSYRIYVIVSRDSSYLLEVPYYFVIQ